MAVNLGGKENKPTLAFCSQLLSGAIYQVQEDLEQMGQQQVGPGRCESGAGGGEKEKENNFLWALNLFLPVTLPSPPLMDYIGK